MKPLWNLYWSPEGKQIAENVSAKTGKAAKRKAPAPYRRYLGEIYAVLANPNAYKAVITLKTEGYLLGGSRNHESSAFERERDAVQWARTAIDINRDREGYRDAVIDYAVFPVLSSNPIPPID